MTRKLLSLVLIAAWTMAAISCAEDREVRTELYNENIYLNKSFLTRANPHHRNAETGARDDYGWLLGTTVTAVSVPTAIPDIFPGLQGQTRYVRFQFTKDTMQIVDGIVPGLYSDDGNLVDPREAQDLAPRVLQEYEGTHVDLQLRRNLDGEVTNFVEEYRERDWEYRQHFKVDLESGALSDLARLDWYYDWSTSPAMELISTSLVPDSYHYVDTVAHESNFPGNVDWAKGDYLEWTVRLTYSIDIRYNSLMNFRANVDTQTVDVKYSLWRRPDPPAGQEYVTRTTPEKNRYLRQFGIWDSISPENVHNFQDPETGLIGANITLSRFNPNRDIHYYLVDMPEEFRNHPENGDMAESIANYTNEVFELAGVDARISFHEMDEGGIIRRPGDIRYSFWWWHNNDFTDIPWLGYGPSYTDPRTGEIINSTLNFNNLQQLHRYAYMVRDWLEQTSDAFDEENAGSCTPGERRPVLTENVRSELHNTTLFSRMVSYMDEEPEEWVIQHDEDWHRYYRMLLPDLRFSYPPYQTFVYTGRQAALAGLQGRIEDLLAGDREFYDVAWSLDSPDSPTGFDDFTSPGAIEAGLDFIDRARESMYAHAALRRDRRVAAGLHGIDLMERPLLIGAGANLNQRCNADGTWQTFDEWASDWRWRFAHQVSIHELGHNLGMYHNFMASVDDLHRQPCTGCPGNATGYSSSVMDYGDILADVDADLGWYPYDVATLIYAYRYDSQEAVDDETDADIIRIVHPEWHDPAIDPADETPGPDGDKHPERAYFYANDFHYPLSPFVELWDRGTTPTEIVYNQIQYYDWLYQFRNFRAWRQYWETWNYPDAVFEDIFWLRRFLELWVLDWDAGSLENDLRLLGVEGNQDFFDNIRDEFDREMGQANRLAINFYQSILTQSNAERSYATTYDSFFGDVTRVGIIYDKFYAMLTFLGLWGADWYNWDVYAYMAYYEYDWGNAQTYSDSLVALDAMLGGSYDVYPWFLPTAVLVFAEDTHNINFGDQAKKEWIGFRAFDRAGDMIDYFGFDPRYECATNDGIEADCALAALGSQDDGHQSFHDADGGEWVYLFLDDRNQHVVASSDLSPISFQLLWDHNESVNIDNLDYVTTYDIKYFLDYYEYFN